MWNKQDEQQEEEKRKAAMYVRMSTEHQNYSIENQTAEMFKYAEKHNLEVVETYSDGAKSGLVAHHRKELQRLLHDVRHNQNQYSVLLIYDVTRFGRYQNSDQAAAYEYMCVEAGVEVIYVGKISKTITAWVRVLKRLSSVRWRAVTARNFPARFLSASVV